MKEHYRDYNYRPPRRVEKAKSEKNHFWRFCKRYVAPRKWALIVCLSLIAINSSSVYLMAFYGRVVVDDILVVKTAEEVIPQERSIFKPDRGHIKKVRRPKQSLGQKMSLGLSSSDRAPDAGRKLFVLAVFYILTQVVLNFCARLATRNQITIAQGITGELREDMHRKILELELAYHQAHSPGRLLSRILSDVQILQNQMVTTLTSVVSSFSLIIVGAIILICTNWQMGLIVVSLLPLYAIVILRTRPKIRHFTKELRHTNSCLYGLTSQKMDAVKAIQAYSREKGELLNFRRMISTFLRDALWQQRISAAFGRSTGLITTIGQLSTFLLGAKYVLDGQMNLGEMLFTRNTALTLFQPVMVLTQLGLVLSRMQVVLQRVVSVLDRPIEIVDAEDAVDFPSPLHHGVSLRKVSFTYPSIEDTEEEPVLHDINLEIPSGSWLCIMGASGCGKTTLVSLLARLHEPTTGSIYLDGVNLNKIRMNSLRRSVGVVPQEAQIFSGTIRDNICYGVPNAEPNQIMAAARAAQLHDFVLTMKIQYETLVGQKGQSLSGGQRQRLSLARALLTEPELLILDDCTSALDAETEHRIQETLAANLVGKTAIIVSQRVSMAKRCHKICVLENGTVSEYGTHQQLLENNGFYARLHAQQTE